MFHYAFIKVECLLDKIILFILTQLYLECLGEVNLVKICVWITLLHGSATLCIVFLTIKFLHLQFCIGILISLEYAFLFWPRLNTKQSNLAVFYDFF